MCSGYYLLVCSLDMLELIIIDGSLSAIVGIEGWYILNKRVQGKKDDVTFLVDPSMDFALQVWISEVSNLVATTIYLIILLCYNALVEPFFSLCMLFNSF